jgi:hypothetical protein
LIKGNVALTQILYPKLFTINSQLIFLKILLYCSKEIQMENINRIGDQKLATIDFNADTGILVFSGRCIPENSVEYFEPLMNWVEAYGASPQPNTVFDIYMDYFNTSSSKCILDLLKELEKIDQAGNSKLAVKWRYVEDDEDMMEAGEDYASMVDIPFELIVKD